LRCRLRSSPSTSLQYDCSFSNTKSFSFSTCASSDASTTRSVSARLHSARPGARSRPAPA
jgi:hypothetical protein